MHILSFVALSCLVSVSSSLAIPAFDQVPLWIPSQLRQIFTAAVPATSKLRNPDERWIDEQKRISLDRLLANVAPSGANVPSAAPGTVIASPSTEHPNYYYHWIRDGAITLQSLVPHLHSGSALAPRVLDIFESYNVLTYRLQRAPNPSGRFYNLDSLGEPKFEVSGAPFTGPWGRPQRDGPALRAITLMEFLAQYNRTHPSLWGTPRGAEWYRDFYDPHMPDMLPNSTVKADLEYVARAWDRPGFDLWEEVPGRHFFTAMVQHRALTDGGRLAIAFGDPGAASWYATQAAQLRDLLHTFWDEGRGHLVSSRDVDRSGLDCSVMLGSLHATPLGEDGDAPFPPHAPEILLSFLALLRDQRARFPINSAPGSSALDNEDDADDDPLRPAGLGRYPEDAYTGYESIAGMGNPWFLCTSTAAELLYRVRVHLQRRNALTITERGLPFWRAVAWNGTEQALAPGEYGCAEGADEGCAVYERVMSRLQTVGDGFLGVVRRHTSAEGTMAEQFDRVTGYERGARDLTWSYGAFLAAVRAREAGLV